jgi:hypothetical protein
VKTLPTGTASSVSDFTERTRALFKDKPLFSPKAPAERKTFRNFNRKAEPQPEAEAAGEVSSDAVESGDADQGRQDD